MNELTGIVAAFIVGFSGLLYVAYDNLEYKGYGNTKSCTGECYEEYVRVNGTLIEQMEAKRLASQADPFSDIRVYGQVVQLVTVQMDKVWRHFQN